MSNILTLVEKAVEEEGLLDQFASDLESLVDLVQQEVKFQQDVASVPKKDLDEIIENEVYYKVHEEMTPDYLCNFFGKLVKKIISSETV